MKKNSILVKIGIIFVLALIALWMMIIGRGHSVYFDNKDIEIDGKTIKAPYKITIYDGDKQVAKLNSGDRGVEDIIGQSLKIRVKIMEVKGGDEVEKTYSLKIPYELDGAVINMPALMNGYDADKYLTEFVPLVTEAAETEPEVDEFGIAIKG